MQKWVFLVLFLVFGVSSFQHAKDASCVSRRIISSPALSPEMVVASVLQENQVPVPLSALILSQAKLESGHFTSGVYTYANNPFGMRPARVRKHKACGQYNGYAAYESLSHAVEDYLLWMDAVCIPLHIDNPESFVRFLLSKGYFEADETDYLRQLRQLIQFAKKDELAA
jgi:hypothetical protein